MNNLGFTKKKIGKTYIVVCGNKREFDIFCNIQLEEFEKGEEFFEGCEFIYYSHPESVLGLCVDEIIQYGTWKSRDDIDYETLKVCIRNDRYRYEKNKN